MVNVEEVKKLIQAVLEPINIKLTEFDKKIEEVTNSLSFLDKKYDLLVKQSQSIHNKTNNLQNESNSAKEAIRKLQDAMSQTKNAIDDIAQYLRRDCVEITGIKPRDEQSCEDIFYALAQEMEIEISEEDISTAHPLPTYEGSDDKIIVKFTKRKIRNEFYGYRRKVAGRKVSSLPALQELNLSVESNNNKIYVSESLTSARKKLFGAVNKLKKTLKWKYIWTNNGKIYLKQADSSRTYTFDSENDFTEFERKMNLNKSKPKPSQAK